MAKENLISQRELKVSYSVAMKNIKCEKILTIGEIFLLPELIEKFITMNGEEEERTLNYIFLIEKFKFKQNQ